MMFRTILSVTLSFIVLSLSAQQITLEDIWKKGTFRQKSVYGVRSMDDGNHYTTMDRSDEGVEINKYLYETGEKVATILTSKEMASMTGIEEFSLEGYEFSPDENQILIRTETENIYRHSTIENYYLVDLAAKSAMKIYNDQKQRHASFSPDGSKIACVVENNIVIVEPAQSKTTTITKDGAQNQIINGYTDWVYEEEFAFDKAFFWSPDGSKIAYYKFNEDNVRQFNMQTFTDLYPEDYLYKYPKAGEDNSIVTIHIYDVKSGNTSDLNLGQYEYIPRIKWTEKSDFLSIMKMPRLQNQLEIMLVETSSLATKSIYKESSNTYIEISDDLTFYNDNNNFIWKSEKDGFFHLYSYDLTGKNEKQITQGEWEVRDFKGYDSKSKQVFFTASKNDPMNTELYSAPVSGGDMNLLSQNNGSNRASFSTTFDYYILYHNTANSPMRVSLHSKDGKEIRILEDNADLNAVMEGINLSEVEFFDFKTSMGHSLNGWMIKPTDFDKKEKYPVLMFVYGGPGSQQVTNSMSGNYWWHQMLAQQGYIVACIDNRGTGGRGAEFRTQTYEQLGKLETEDQIEGAKYLANQSYVDGSRIGIWGWSYGGYMSSLSLMKGADVFKAAIAVAPVTNWRFYDSIYTERYMGLPQENGSGYDDNSPINHVDKLEGNYLLVHGTGDDNVHYQNSVEMVDALVEADKQFEYSIYPERNHGIYGGNTRFHLYTKMTNFLMEKL
ncbi:S9 family peptidase [Salibacteraceae bacterium]|nr:S9 family peptidase [Salibacteraceae bacterium]